MTLLFSKKNSQKKSNKNKINFELRSYGGGSTEGVAEQPGGRVPALLE